MTDSRFAAGIGIPTGFKMQNDAREENFRGRCFFLEFGEKKP